MKQKVLTDVELRARWNGESGGEYHVEQGTVLTPAARDFLRERNVRLCVDEGTQAYQTMTVEPIPLQDGKPQYIDARTGEELARKGEGMTHLRGNLLVPKTHPRIAFRGALDSLMARWLLTSSSQLRRSRRQGRNFMRSFPSTQDRPLRRLQLTVTVISG